MTVAAEQKRVPFGAKGMIAFIAFLNAFVPLSTDMFLPALPQMVRIYETTPEVANGTLSFFMLFFAVSMPFWGPLTDKHGRKPVLLAGSLLFATGAIICVFAADIYVLIGARCVQAVGAGAISAVSMAIVKDVYQGLIMERILAWIQSISVLCPMFAPVIGAFVLRVIDWRGIFVIFALSGILSAILSLVLTETLTNPTEGSTFASLSRIGFVLKHKGYLILLIIFSLMAMPIMSFLSTSSFIYIDMFGKTEQEYSFFFMFNAFFSMMAPICYMRFFRRLPRNAFLTTCFVLVLVSGLLVLFYGNTSPFAFAGLFVIAMFCGSASRPAGTMLIMNQLDTDNGTVGSLFSSTALLIGSGAMMVCSLGWPDKTWAVGAICTATGTCCLVLWLIAVRYRIFRVPEA